MRWKQYQGPVLLTVLIAAALIAAFLHGGRTVSQEKTDAPAPPAVSAQTAAPVTEQPAQEPPAELPDPEPPETGETRPTPEQAGPAEAASAPEPENVPADELQETPEAPSCTISISCWTILEHMDQCPPEKAELVPEDGWVLRPTAVSFTEGESVFDVLQRTCRQNQIHMEYMDTPGYGSAYIEGIHNLYEFDVGELSGWMYSVNGQFPNRGCSQTVLRDGDVICWLYTCDYGADVGGNNFAA